MLIKASTDTAPTATIEITPMIDMVFLLLIFFLVATTFRQEEREINIALPIASSGGPISSVLRELVVNIDVDGGVVVNGRSSSLDELEAVISEAVAVNAEQKVTVRGDRNTAYANVVRVLDICKAAGVQQPYLDTVVEP